MKHKHMDVAFNIKAVSEDGAFEGYGSVFNVKDSYDDIVVKGAFVDSLMMHGAKGSMPALLWQHDSDEPIGVYTEMREDDTGLYVKGQLALKTQRGAEAYELLKMKAISGMSIGYVTREDSYDRVTGVNTLKKLDLWEVSLVTFPANTEARVSGVKSIEEMKNLGDAESRLRDAGFSKTEATAFVSRVKRLGRGDPDEDNGVKALREAVERRNAVFRCND